MNTSLCFLVFDTDPCVSAYLADVVRVLGYRTECCARLSEVQHRLEAQAYAGLFLDGRTLHSHGRGFLSWLRQNGREEPLILIGAHSEWQPTTELHSEARIKLLPRPVSPSLLRSALRWAMRKTEGNEFDRSGRTVGCGVGLQVAI